MSIRFIHIADVHIGMSFASASFGQELGNIRREEIKATFFRILDACVKNNVDLLLIAGDLFEEDYITMSELKDIQKKFANMTNTNIVISAGNHDPILNERSSYHLVNWSDNVYIFPNQLAKLSLDELNVDIYSFSWSKKEIKTMNFDELAIEDSSRTNILMLHGDAYNHSNYLPLSIDDLALKAFDYIALGHIHKADIINDKGAYPGSPEPLDFKETGEHGIIEGVIDGSDVNIRFNPFAKREFIIKEIVINEDMSFEEIRNMAINEVDKQNNPNAMYRLYIKGIKDIDVDLNIDLIKESLQNGVFYCEVINNTQNNYDLERIKRNHKGNIIEEFIKYMEECGLDNPQMKDALNEGLNILLREKVD